LHSDTRKERLLALLYLSVCSSTRISWAPTNWIFCKIRYWKFLSKRVWWKSEFG